MSTRITGAVCAAAFLLAAGGAPAPAAAQDRILIGQGSSIGVSVSELATDAGVQAGVQVREVQRDSPAERAGFRTGDIVIEFDGERVRSARQFSRIVQETPPNREVAAVVLRESARQTLQVTPEVDRSNFTYAPRGGLQILPRLEPFQYQLPRTLRPLEGLSVPAGRRLGVSAIALDAQLAEYFGVEDGVLVTSVDADSPAARAGLRAGDVMTQVGSRTVRTPADVTQAIASVGSGATVELQVMRDRKQVRLQATLPGSEQQEPPRERFRL